MSDIPQDHPIDPRVAVFYHQISSIQTGMGELKGMLSSLDERLRQHELHEAKEQATQSQKLDSAHARLDEVETDVKSRDGNRVGDIKVLDDRLGAIELKMPLIDDILDIRVKLIVWVFISGFLGTTISGLILALLFNYVFGGFSA